MVDSRVNVQVNIKSSQPQIQRIKKQDEEDHWISEEELYTEGSSDEEKPSNLSRKHLKGLSYEEIAKKENDLMEMKNSINRLEEALANSKVIDEIYDIGKTWEKHQDFDVVPKSEKIESKIAEVKNLDKVLKLKTEEVKMAKKSRMRDAEEFTQLLMDLSKSSTSEAVKNNSEQFLRLLENEVNDHAGDCYIFRDGLECMTDKNGENRAVKVLPKNTAKSGESPWKPTTFIDRNIQLAKCGDGVLSLTDEEKLRLQIVLQDIDESVPGQIDNILLDIVPPDNQYVLNEAKKKTLEEIDRKLQEHEKTKISFNSIRSSVLGAKTIREDAKDDGGKNKIKSKILTTVDNDFKRLKEVDKLLNSLNSTTNEAISPLLDEDLQYLIEESRQLLYMSTGGEPMENAANLKMPSKEKITELVSAAKTGMPNFKFRYEH